LIKVTNLEVFALDVDKMPHIEIRPEDGALELKAVVTGQPEL